jgi:SAM-dependent methyltransferase
MDLQEFDKFADEYDQMHARNVAVSGYTPQYFAEYKIKDVALELGAEGGTPRTILDFGSGVGNSIPYFRKYFPRSQLTCADVSGRSLEVSRARFPGDEVYAPLAGDRLPFSDNSLDLIFSACVFHHIPHEEHAHWLGELNRIAAAHGRLFIFEHNPWNPLTVSAVRTCPFDENAHLIRSPTFARCIRDAGWTKVTIRYRLFFPRILGALRGLERYLAAVPLGAQYYISAEKAARTN